MSNSNIKAITINQELFNVKSKTGKNKTLKNRGGNRKHLKPNNLKSELLEKIKNYKQNKQLHNGDGVENNVENNKISLIKDDADSTSNSIKKQHTTPPAIIFKKNIIKSASTPNIDSTLEDDDFSQSINFLRELSTKKHNKNVKREYNHPVSLGNLVDSHNSNSSQNPQFGCLKNGSLPTYREWKNKTLKKSAAAIDVFDTTDNIEINMKKMSETHKDSIKEYNEGFRESQKLHNDNLGVIPQKKTTTLKYYLGKRGKKVSVLIKNSQTRKKIIDEHSLLKQAKLSDMKSYLKRHNLLKSGSHAPPEVIKKLYEQSLLGGDIRNSNKNNIIYNYLSE